uniref:Uncharacterized protein n=1 Tax=Analipus japonicus TaxID=31333 RepID=A0A8F0FDB5_9PHAE|nr:hypothetical protein [Analipus japonicus]
MFTPRKRHLRKKRFFLLDQKTFALFNGSNLKASRITRIKLSLQKAKLYSVPLYLAPPKLALGYPLLMVIYENLEDFQTNAPEVASQIDCLGISIKNEWYPIELLENNKIKDLNKKALALLLTSYKRSS